MRDEAKDEEMLFNDDEFMEKSDLISWFPKAYSVSSEM
jgi:hypothetical protein